MEHIVALTLDAVEDPGVEPHEQDRAVSRLGEDQREECVSVLEVLPSPGHLDHFGAHRRERGENGPARVVELPHVTVLDFGRSEIDRFAEQWCLAFASWTKQGKMTQLVKREAEEAKNTLLSDLYSNPSIERLATNPLGRPLWVAPYRPCLTPGRPSDHQL